MEVVFGKRGGVGGGGGAGWGLDEKKHWCVDCAGSSVFFNVPAFISSRSCQR